jgi:hypothetical protein
MKIKSVAVLMMLLLLFVQCRKEKDEKPAPDLTKGLLAYFELNGQFKDSANDFDVDYGGFLDWAKNRHGYAQRALSLNGGSFGFLTPWWRANAITVSLWVKPKDLNNNAWLVSSTEGAFGVYQKLSTIGLAISNPDTASALASIKNEWTHVAGTFDGTEIKTYINGKLTNRFHHPGVPDVTSSVIIGNFQTEWKGTIDDLRFYNRVLSAEEIKLLYEL